MSADMRYRGAGMAGAITVQVPDDENGVDLELRNADTTRCVEKITPDLISDRSADKVLDLWHRYFHRRRGGS
jgi:hypothetical protein